MAVKPSGLAALAARQISMSAWPSSLPQSIGLIHRQVNEPDDNFAPSTRHQTTDRFYCEHWPSNGKPCSAPATWTICTPEQVALRHACNVHSGEVLAGVVVPHEILPHAEWLASSRGYRPGRAGS
ncbi:MAG TPA: hypothetical protein VFM14_07530 [Gemmatimonadales bacterium]|nr:hypothetical protein [Gemmatimonadales bacterium]